MNKSQVDLSFLFSGFKSSSPYKKIGKIESSNGLLYEVNLARGIIGSNVEFLTDQGQSCLGEIVSIKGKKCLAMPYESLTGINTETKVILKDLTTTIKMSHDLLGRVIDFRAQPLDDKGAIQGPYNKRSIYSKPLNPLKRPPIRENLDTGIGAINSFLSVGKGQRMSIMAGSGVGKSVLLGMIAKNTKADINVIALIGERGREVREFIENELGEEGLKRSVVIVATSDTSPLIRIKAAFTAMTIAEYFRDDGMDVMLMMDSITRLAMAQREIGLSAGEPPGLKGYPPSVFSQLPKILERAGTKNDCGSITGFFTVLVEGGDMDEPIADSIRAIVDGHIILSRELAAKNHFPAIDVLSSISRVMNTVVSKEQKVVASYLRDLLATYKESEDLINVGAYTAGINEKLDKAVMVYDDLVNFLKQDINESLSMEMVFEEMVRIARKAEGVAEENKEEEPEENKEFNVI